MTYPPLATIRQQFATERLDDVEERLDAELERCGLRLPTGGRIAIAVGSRGIANLQVMVRRVVDWVRSQGADPFIVPAMGSHGGATGEGQQRVLESYGITQASVGAPIVSSMDVVQLPQGDAEVPVWFDRSAAGAAGTIFINRVKPHTSFHARYESGLMKMIAIGLGKHAQALAIHSLGVRGLREVLPQVARQILRHGNILLGVAVVENALDETMLVRAIRAEDIPDQEPALLEIARAQMPRLPVSDIDILIVDEMGKNISGLGMDPNIIGRLKIPGQPEPESPRIRMIIVRDLTPETHGNAVGVGLADITTRTLFSKINFAATYENAVTATFLERAKIPMIAETDRQALDWAARACNAADPAQLRIVRIQNTLRLDTLQVSPAVLADLAGRKDIETIGPASPILNDDGSLIHLGPSVFIRGSSPAVSVDSSQPAGIQALGFSRS